MKHLLSILALILLVSCAEDSLAGSDSSGSDATNGSYSQVIVVGDFLYGLNDDMLTTVDISDKDNSFILHQQELAFDIESILHHDGLLFIGSSSRMYIYEIGRDGIPSSRSETEYELDNIACWNDPIVVSGDYAYVTLSTTVVPDGGPCQRTTEFNELRIYDVSDIENPEFLESIWMENPKGLGIDDDHLFICDGYNGLVVFNLTDPVNPVRLHHFPGFTSYDLITRNGLLIVIAQDQLLQFDYTDIENMRLLSSIEL